MGFFENLRKKRELLKLERQVEQNPTPSNMSMLAERYIHMGELDKAFEIAQQGVRAFPNSEKVLRTFRYIKKMQLQAKIRDLNTIIQKNPNPVAYGQLAMIYKDLGETHKAVDICTELTNKFPLSENSYLIIGEIRYQRFHEDLLAKDGQLTIENLEKALELNSSNYKALLLSAEIYVEIGLLDKAVRNLRQILEFAPTDDRVHRLLAECEELAASTPSIDDDEQEWLFIQVENRRQFTNIIRGPEMEKMIVATAGPSVVQYTINQEILKRQINALAKMPGLMGAIALDKETGKILADRIVLRVKKQDLEEMVKTVFRVSQNASLRMDVGSLNAGRVSGPFGSLHLVAVEGILVAILVDAQTKPDLVEITIQEMMPTLSNAISVVK
ncbi:MAG: tetratricopeptide repeat protein [Planctomycetota bacterium]|jgi:tetratricopeptide (TPR) repeat protein